MEAFESTIRNIKRSDPSWPKLLRDKWMTLARQYVKDELQGGRDMMIKVTANTLRILCQPALEGKNGGYKLDFINACINEFEDFCRVIFVKYAKFSELMKGGPSELITFVVNLVRAFQSACFVGTNRKENQLDHMDYTISLMKGLNAIFHLGRKLGTNQFISEFEAGKFALWSLTLNQEGSRRRLACEIMVDNLRVGNSPVITRNRNDALNIYGMRANDPNSLSIAFRIGGLTSEPFCRSLLKRLQKEGEQIQSWQDKTENVKNLALSGNSMETPTLVIATLSALGSSFANLGDRKSVV